jgi:hypothetical protein
MKTFLIAYDLRNKRNYLKLYIRLARLRARRVLESVWILKGDYTSRGLLGRLTHHIDTDDELLVVEISGCVTWNTRIDSRKRNRFRQIQLLNARLAPFRTSQRNSVQQVRRIF